MTAGPNRRKLLALGGLALGGVAVWKSGLYGRILGAPDLPFVAIAGLDGYRVLKGGAISLGGVPLFGLDDEPPAGLIAAQARLEQGLCSALFRHPGAAGRLPIAYFYDYQCPICRKLTPRLRALTNVTLSWHDLAGLGPASETAARAAIAARKQGAFDAFHDRLMRAVFQPNDGYIRSLAGSIGVDIDRLLRDIDSPETDRSLWLSRALASRFGMIGTPGLVIGRSVVIGDIPARHLHAIIAQESASAPNCG